MDDSIFKKDNYTVKLSDGVFKHMISPHDISVGNAPNKDIFYKHSCLWWVSDTRCSIDRGRNSLGPAHHKEVRVRYLDRNCGDK